MELSTLFAGAVQAAPSTAAAAPAAAPGPVADPAGDGGFASLVALALGEACLAPAAVPAAAGTPAVAPSGRVRTEDADEPAEDAASPLDASVDAATLSVLIALATPMVVLPVTADPVSPAPAAELAPIEALAPGVGPMTLAAPDAAWAPAGPVVASAPAPAPTPAPAAAAAPPFTVDQPVADGPAPAPVFTNVSELPPGVDVVSPPPQAKRRPAASAEASQTAPAVAPAPAAVPDAGTGASAAAAPVSEAAPAPAAAQPATAPAVATPQPAAPPSAPQTRRAAPLRAALTAMAADQGTDAQPAASAPASDARPVAAPAAVAAPAPLTQADAAPAATRRDLAPATAAPASQVAASAASPVASRGDAGSAAQDGADDPRSTFSGPAFRSVAAPRIDAAATAPMGDPVAASAPPSVVVPVTASAAMPELALRPIELPAVARFEQTLASIDPDTRNLQAMVRTVRLFSGVDGASEARLQLDPEHLGPVALTVRVEQGTVSAHFRAETPAAQRWIETHQQELRAGLREQGLEVREVVVTTDPDGRRDRRQDAPPARPARARRSSADADAPRFEVLV